MKRTSILLADDHSLVRIGLKTLLNAQSDLHVVGEAEDGAEAVRLYAKLAPDVVVMDLMMPTLNGAEATQRIREKDPSAKVIILTSYTTAADLARALRNGAAGAQLKGSSTDGLLAAIRAVACGETAIDPDLQKLMKLDDPPPELTARQEEILKGVVDGFTTEAIAARQGISVSAVKQHIALICNKLGAATRTEAAVLALRRHLLG